MHQAKSIFLKLPKINLGRLLIQTFKEINSYILRVSHDGKYCTVTAQLPDLDARDIIRDILHCFTRLDIRVYIDFFFMMSSKTRYDYFELYHTYP